MAGFSVVGYDDGELLGFGAFGEVWSARSRATGRLVALRRIREPDGSRRERLRAGASVLATLKHPHLVRVHSAVAADDSVVLVLDHVGGGSLTRLMERRSRLSAGEVVTLLVPLAQALSVVHDHGLAHGRVTAASVLLAEDGRPMLADAGLVRLVGAPEPLASGLGDPTAGGGALAGQADDVHDLAATCWAALVGHSPYDAAGARVPAGQLDPAGRRVVAALEAALVADRQRRSSVDDLAARALAAAPAAPLQLAASGRDVAHRTASAGQAQGSVAPTAPPRRLPAAAARAPSQRAPSQRPPSQRAARGHRVSGKPRPAAGWRAWAGASFCVAALAMAALTGLAWAGADAGAPAADLRPVGQPASKPSPRGSATGTATQGPASAETAARGAAGTVRGAWWAILERLDARRAAAFAAADVERLRTVYAEGSPALVRDRTRLAGLVAAGVRARGLHLRATEVSPRRTQPSRVVLRVVDRLDPYELRDLDGTLVERRAGRGDLAWTVTLLRENGAWRVYDVAAS